MRELHDKNSAGFTLVEILVAVGVLAVGTLAFLPSFSGANKQKALTQSVENAKDAVVTARNRALTETGNPEEVNAYKYSGVRFTKDSGEYKVFRSNTATADVCANLVSGVGINVMVDANKTLPGGVVARLAAADNPVCMFFEYGTGDACETKGSVGCSICND